MMHSFGYIYTILCFLIVHVVIGCESINSLSSSRSTLDSLLQEYAFKGLSWPKTKTGTVYYGPVPSTLTGIKISALMLRRDNLKWRGYGYYHEFLIPTGVIEEPYVTRIVFVYQNIGNWSSSYYPLPGNYIYLTPVLGIFAYDAMDMCAKVKKPDLNIHALEKPININFTDVQPAPEGSTLKCVYFKSNSKSIKVGNVTNGNVCSTRKQGHFAIVAELNIAPSPASSADDHGNNNQLISSKVLTISVGFFIFAVVGVLFVVAKKFVLVERRLVLEDSAALIIEPLLRPARLPGLGPEPEPEESPSRHVPVNDYAIRPLPENDYLLVANNNLPETDYEGVSESNNEGVSENDDHVV